MSHHEFSIQTVCRLLGLNQNTLRAWERRYNLVSPKRRTNGRRFYGREQVERLRLTLGLLKIGYKIGDIYHLKDEELGELLCQTSTTQDSTTRKEDSSVKPRDLGVRVEALGKSEAQGTTDANIERMIACLHRYRVFELEQLLLSAQLNLSSQDFLLHLVVPFMQRIGAEYLRGKISVDQEHVASSLVKGNLMHLLYSTISLRTSRYKFILATMEGDLHEVGTLVAACILKLLGHTTWYFGPNLPSLALAKAAKELGANTIVLGCSDLSIGELPIPREVYLNVLSANLPRNSQIWIGGTASLNMDQYVGPCTVVRLPNFETLLSKVTQELSSKT